VEEGGEKVDIVVSRQVRSKGEGERGGGGIPFTAGEGKNVKMFDLAEKRKKREKNAFFWGKKKESLLGDVNVGRFARGGRGKVSSKISVKEGRGGKWALPSFRRREKRERRGSVFRPT